MRLCGGVVIKYVSNVRQVIKHVDSLAKQMPFINSLAINTTARQAKAAVIEQIKAKVDRPTSYTLNSIYMKPAEKSQNPIVASIGVKDMQPSKGTAWTDALGHLFTGGTRQQKKSESALVRKGQFQGGKSFLGLGSPEFADQYGNLPKSKIIQLMSYFNSFKENGYKANKNDKQRKRMAKITGPATKRNPSPYVTINGVMYFISRGKGWFVGQGKGWSGGRNQPLGAGIWQKKGIGGVDVKPVLTAIRQPNYRKLIDLYAIVKDVVDKNHKQNFADAFNKAMRTAR